MSKLSDYSDSFRDQRDILKAINSELGLQKDALQASKKEMSNLESIALKLQNNEEELSKLSQNQLKNLQDKATIALRELKTNVSQLKNRKDLTTEEKALVKQYKSGFAIETKFVGKVKERLELQKKVNKSMGIFGGALKGISKIPIIGDLFDAESALGDMEKSLLNNESSVTAMSKGFQNIGGQVIDGLMNPANIALATFTGILSIFKQLDKEAGEFAKSMNMSYGEALQVRQEMSSLAVSSGDLALNATKLTKTLGEVGAALGTNALLNDKDLKTFTKLTNQAGFTADELMNIQKLSLANGKSLDDNVSSIMGGSAAFAAQNKLALNEKQILKDVNGMSASLKLSLEGGTEALGAAAAQARKFGINLQQAESIASSLLDFESSIENELSAELLIGRDLNLEKARGLALNGEATKAAAELLKQVGGSAKFGEMNVIAQESLAKAMGMQREELAASLIESEALKDIGAESAKEAREKYDTLRQTMSAEEAMTELGNDQLAKQFEQQSNAEKLADVMSNLKEIFVSIVDGPLGSMLSGISTLLSSTTAVYSITGLLAGLYAGKMIKGLRAIIMAKKTEKGLSVGAAIIDIIKGAWNALGGIAVIGPALALGAIAGGVAYVNSQKNVKDGVIQPDGGISLSTQKGTIQLDKEDSVVAGTNLFGEKGGRSGGGSAGGGGANMAQTNSLLQQLIDIISAGGDVVLDGQKVGNALNLVAYKTQ